MPGGRGWAKPGEAANLFKWNLGRGGRYTEPGKMPLRREEQVNLPNLPSDWSPSAAPKYRVEVSKPGQVPPQNAWNFALETGSFVPPGQEVRPEDVSRYTHVSPMLEEAPVQGAVMLRNAPAQDPREIIRRELGSPSVGVGGPITEDSGAVGQQLVRPQAQPQAQPRVQPPAAGGVPTTVDISGGRTSSADTSSLMGQILQMAAGYGLPTRVVQAILVTEGGLAGDIGDYGKSFGPFQFYGGGGQLNAFAAEFGFGNDWRAAGRYILQNPLKAADWALRPGGYLGDTIRRGMSRGISGDKLATYAQEYGQVSVTPERAGRVYLSLGDSPGGITQVPARVALTEDSSPSGGRLATPSSLQSLGGPLSPGGPKVQGRPIIEDEGGVGQQMQAEVDPRTPLGQIETFHPSYPSDLNWGGAISRWRQQFGGTEQDAYQDLLRPESRNYLESALGMARAGEVGGWKPVGTGQEGFADYAGRRLQEGWGQITNPQQWYDPALGAMGILGIPFEPFSAATRYGVSAAAQAGRQALTGEQAAGYDPETALTWYEENVPMPLQMLTELAAPMPPLGKLAKLAKLGKAPKAKKGWMGAVAEGAMEEGDRLLDTQGMRLPSGKEGDVARGGRRLSAYEDPERLEREAALWTRAGGTGVPGEAEELSRKALGMSFPAQDVESAFGRKMKPVSEMGQGQVVDTMPTLSETSELRSLQEFDPRSIVPERQGYERGGYASPSVGEKGKMGQYLSSQEAEATANRMLGTASLEEFSRGAGDYAHPVTGRMERGAARVIVEDVLGTGYLDPSGKIIVFPRQLEEIVSKGGYEERLDKMMDALVPSRDPEKQVEAYDALLSYLIDHRSPVLLDLRHGSVEPMEFYDLRTKGGLTQILHNWRGGKKNPSSMGTTVEGGIDPRDMELIQPDLEANRGRRWAHAMEKEQPKEQTPLKASKIVRTLFPEDVAAVADLERELWKYGIKRDRAAEVMRAASEGKTVRILRTEKGMDLEFASPSAAAAVVPRGSDDAIRRMDAEEEMYDLGREVHRQNFPESSVVEYGGRSFRAVPEAAGPMGRIEEPHVWGPAGPGEGEEARIKIPGRKPIPPEQLQEKSVTGMPVRKWSEVGGDQGTMSFKEHEYGDPYYGTDNPRIPDHVRIPYERAVEAGDLDEVARLQPRVDEFVQIDQPASKSYAREDFEAPYTGAVESIRPVNTRWPGKPTLTEGKTAAKLPSTTQKGGGKMAGGEIGKIEAQLSSFRKQWSAAKTPVQRKAIEEAAAKLKQRLAELEGIAPGQAPGFYTATNRQEMMDRFAQRMAARAGRLRKEAGDEQDEEERLEE